MADLDPRLLAALDGLNDVMRDESAPWSVVNQALNRVIRAARDVRARKRVEAVRAAQERAETP